MEEKLNLRKDRRGMHGNQRKGKDHPKAKGWILYQHGDEIGYFGSLTEVADFCGKSYHYLWMLAKGILMDRYGEPRTITQEGWSIKPAKTIEFTNK